MGRIFDVPILRELRAAGIWVLETIEEDTGASVGVVLAVVLVVVLYRVISK